MSYSVERGHGQICLHIYMESIITLTDKELNDKKFTDMRKR